MLLKENSSILIPIDFSKQSIVAAKYSYQLAKLTHCKLIVMHVYKTGSPDHASDLVKLKEEIENESKLTVETLNLEGDIFELTDKKAEELECSCIVAGLDTHVRFRSFMGTNQASKFIKNAPCPVITIRAANNQPAIRNIVLPVDLSPESREKVGIAVQFAKYYHADIRIISIFHPSDQKYENKLLPYLQQIKKFIKDKGVNCTNKSIPSTDPPTAIVDYANKNECDLIIQMNKKDKSLGEMFSGTMSEKLVDVSNIAVLSVNPMQRASISTGIH
jgi:nucleotide-binding universal stress UspA family protein